MRESWRPISWRRDRRCLAMYLRPQQLRVRMRISFGEVGEVGEVMLVGGVEDGNWWMG